MIRCKQPRLYAERLHPGKQHAHRRVKRYGEKCGHRDGKGFGLGQRREEPSLLVHQRENREK